MSFNAYCRVEVRLRPDTTNEQVREACRPFLDWRGDSLKPNDSDLHETGVAFDPYDAHFVLQVTGSCPNSFAHEIFDPLIKAIGNLAAEAFEALLINESTSSDDERLHRLVSGPADQVEEFRSQAATRSIGEWLAEVSAPPGSRGPGMDAGMPAGFEILMRNGADNLQRPRISVDLAGLPLSERERGQITRLAVVLARVIGGHGPLEIQALGDVAEADEPAASDSPRG
ncbi:hypothetical protein [uncultured Variovorax sp.]|uniref:hypothetical protein n=1 Tax=uncultured Variovorax sp. TaxID=114708 RepID=UPI0026257ABE|nr:hypothetical protein [uncultured Variovorax sp.]